MNKDGDKTLSFQEMSRLLRRGNPDMTDRELRILYDNVDKNHDGKVDFDEFVDFIFSTTGEERETRRTRGPERFFYDKSSYTGVHTRGGPSTLDGGGFHGSFRGGGR